VPDVETLKEWAIDNDIDGTLSVLCNNEMVKDMILNEMTKLGKEAGLKSFEQVIPYSKNPVYLCHMLSTAFSD
jgi:long-chain acyl-CoA synthetase